MGQYYYPIFLNNGGGIMAWLLAQHYDCGLKLMEHSFIGVTFMNSIERELGPYGRFYMSNVVWAGDYADAEPKSKHNLFNLCDDSRLIRPEPLTQSLYRYLVNHTKKEFVDKAKIPPIELQNIRLHPLPILTCEGNGRGGGDFSGEHELIGSWARHSISLELEQPDRDNYTEVLFTLQE